MDFSKLTRNPAVIHASLMRSGNSLITKTGCKIYIPTRYAEHNLAHISNEIKITCISAMVVGNSYAVDLTNAMMQITPSSTSIVEINDEDHFEFTFEKGSQISPNINLVINDTLVYHIYDEIIAKGHVPFFLSYEDVGKLFVSAEEHGGIKLASNNVPLEMIATAITRSAKDPMIYYRHVINDIREQYKIKPEFIAFRNVSYGATNTTAKLMGAYFDEGLLSAFANPSKNPEKVETLLRM